VLTAEIELRTNERVDMRVLMMMQDTRDNSLAREVLGSADMGRPIQMLAWEDARF